MQTENNSQSVMTSPQSFDASRIERELNSFWQEAGKDDGVTRSCVLNLIVFTNAINNGHQLDELLTEVTARHPSRAILIAADREATDSALTTQVVSRCAMPTATTRQVCCEQVTIHALGKQIHEVHSAVAQLLLSDLPIFLWWRSVPPLADKVFTRLAGMANRVIIDSASFTDQHGDLLSLALLLRERPKWTAFSDLNWARLTAWRALLAGFYDIAEYRPALQLANRVVIEYAPLPDQPDAISSRALLLAGWLATRLRWRLDKVRRDAQRKAVICELLAPTQRIFIEFRATERAAIEPGHLAQVTLRADSFAEEAADACFTITRSDEGERLRTSIFNGYEARAGRVLSYPRQSESELIWHELEIVSHDQSWEQAVRMTGEMLVALTLTQDNQLVGE